MNTGLEGTWLKFAFVAFLAVAGLTGAAPRKTLMRAV